MLWAITLGYVVLAGLIILAGARLFHRTNEGGYVFGACVLACLVAIPYWAIAGYKDVGIGIIAAGIAFLAVNVVIAFR